MRKILCFRIGGLHSRILRLVLILLIVTVSVNFGVSLYQARYLSDIVSRTRDEQQTAIKSVSGQTIRQLTESSLDKSNALQAYIADEMFADVRNDVMVLKQLAETLFEKREGLAPYPYARPDAANDGRLTAQVLSEAGVDDADSEYLGIAAHMSDTMTAMCSHSSYMHNCFFGLADGTLLCVDSYSANKFDASGRLMDFPVRERPWYQNAAKSGELCFSGVEYDTYSGKICVTCSAPVETDGTLVGVVGIDLFLDSMEAYVSAPSGSSYLSIINSDGQAVFATHGNPLFTVETAENAADLRDSAEKELAAFVASAMQERTGLQTVNVNGNAYWMAGSPMKTVGWSVISLIEQAQTEQPVQEMLSSYDSINEMARSRYTSSRTRLRTLSFLATAGILLLGIIAALLVAGRIVRPIESMTADITEGAKTGKLFEMKPLYRTGDEINVLAESFEDLSKKTQQYIEDITAITKEKERVDTELSLASDIQSAMLPHIFPPFPERKEFDLFAVMEPAREVGGDFYDFFLIDDDHLCLVMADVSGKGIPAALYMMIAKTILQSCAMLGRSPAEILTKTNEGLCSDDEVEMFVTVWLGILEISTGTLTAANAGHEYPVLMQDGRFSLRKDKHSFAVGGMAGMHYKEYTLRLQPGDKLFLYTDGVPEAANGERGMFGTDRMLEALNAEPDASPEMLLKNVRKAVREFVQGAEQFDDLTMLCLEYKGNRNGQ